MVRLYVEPNRIDERPLAFATALQHVLNSDIDLRTGKKTRGQRVNGKFSPKSSEMRGKNGRV